MHDSQIDDCRNGRAGAGTGVELHVAQSGPPDGTPVLFLHGFPDSWFSYSNILLGLPANVRAIVPSQRGHGESERPECCYRIIDLARDAVALLDALGIEGADIICRSLREALPRALPTARFIGYPDLGHSPFWEDPIRVGNDVAKFLVIVRTAGNR